MLLLKDFLLNASVRTSFQVLGYACTWRKENFSPDSSIHPYIKTVLVSMISRYPREKQCYGTTNFVCLSACFTNYMPTN